MQNKLMWAPRLYLIAMLSAFLFVSACTGDKAGTGQTAHFLWYDEPAQAWEDALPLGNGRIGAMVFGDTIRERIQLNDDSLWPADAGWDDPDGNAEDLNTIRDLLIEGKHVEADAMMVEKFSRKDIMRSHQTLGDLFIEFGHSNITDYRRELDIGRALASLSYNTHGHQFSQKVFASHPHQAIVIEIESDAPDGLNGKILLQRPEDRGFSTAVTAVRGNNMLVMEGEVSQRGAVFDSKPAPILEGVKFETCVKVEHSGGAIESGDDFLEMRNVKKAVIFLVSNSSYYYDDYRAQNSKELQALDKAGLKTLIIDHVIDYQQLFSRVSLKLTDESLDSLPTDDRLRRVREGAFDPELEALLFQYGRYLLISSSRPGTNPANLQGLWNPHIEAPWNADYHLNINLQMNYWLADVTNLSELNGPLFDYVDRLVESGKSTAWNNFGCRGSFLPHASDLWVPTWLQARTAYWGSSFGAGGWMMQHYREYFLFNLDTVFLKERAFPALHEIAQFYSDWIIEDPRDGTLVSAPSSSPENQFIDAAGNPATLCLGSAVDQQTIAEVFDSYIMACRVLDINTELLDTIVRQRAQLRPGFVRGSDGRILEWDREYPEYEPGHRHMSHLYGFHPGTDVTQLNHPELFEAVRKTLDYRLANGGAGTGWSRAWLINCAARLLDGEMAYDHIQFLIRRSLYNNLFDAHPPFQIDGNFGYTAGVAEMLLQSHEENTLRILPALPAAWATGFVTGLKARGGYTLDIHWAGGSIERLIVKSGRKTTINLIYRGSMIAVDIEKGINEVDIKKLNPEYKDIKGA